MVGSLASERLLFSTGVLFSATLKTIIDNEKFIFKLTLWISLHMIHLLTVPSSQWIFLTFKKSLLDTAFLRCTVVAFIQLHQRNIYWVLLRCHALFKDKVGGVAGGREKAKAFTEVDRSFVIEVQSPGHHFFVYLLCSRPVLSNWNTVGAVNASHMCYFKFSSHYIKKRNDILVLCI